MIRGKTENFARRSASAWLGVALLPVLCASAPQVSHAQAGLRRLFSREQNQVNPDLEFELAMRDGLKRRYLVHVPAGYDGKRPLPVVLAFHGGGGRAEVQREQSQLNRTADKHGFLVVYPDGTGRLRLLTWNAGTCCGYAVQNNIDDVAFTAQLLDQLQAQFPIDARRVYATGLSNGGMLSYRLACELSDRIAAIAPVAGDMGVDGPPPKRPVPVIHFHGLKDPNVLFEGGIGPNQFQKTPHRSIPDSLAFWIRANNCQPEPQIEQIPDAVIERWTPARGQAGAPVVLYKLPGGGHNWPGGVDTTARLGTGPHVSSVDASEIMWKFFEQHPLPAH
jgi:polyhydroxybutyrate depolymerase